MSLSRGVSAKTAKGGRTYQVGTDGEERFLPSVTTILRVIDKPFLLPWSIRLEREYLLNIAGIIYQDSLRAPKPFSRAEFLRQIEANFPKGNASDVVGRDAAALGTAAHKKCEWFLKGMLGAGGVARGPEPEVRWESEWAFQTFKAWVEKTGFLPTLVEQTVYSLKYGYAGTMDILGILDGETVLIDIKTSGKIYRDSFRQNVAYQEGVNEMGLSRVTRGLTIRLPKTKSETEVEVAWVPDREVIWQEFLAALTLWKGEHATP